jgi:hypothetical protein
MINAAEHIAMENSRYDKAATNKSATASALFVIITPSLKVSDPLNPHINRTSELSMAVISQVNYALNRTRVSINQRHAVTQKRLHNSILREQSHD